MAFPISKDGRKSSYFLWKDDSQILIIIFFYPSTTICNNMKMDKMIKYSLLHATFFSNPTKSANKTLSMIQSNILFPYNVFYSLLSPSDQIQTWG